MEICLNAAAFAAFLYRTQLHKCRDAAAKDSQLVCSFRSFFVRLVDARRQRLSNFDKPQKI